MHPTIENQMRDELKRIHTLAEKCSGKGTVIALDRGYIAGVPFIFSTDSARAFRFKNKTQAAKFLKRFRVDGGLRTGKVVTL